MTRNVTYAPGVPSSISDTLIYKLETEETKNKRYVCMSMYLCLLYPKAFYIMLWCYLCKHYFSTHLYIYIICHTQGSLSISLTLYALHTFVSYACMYLLLKHLLLTRLVVCLLLRVFVIFLLYFFFYCCCCLYVLLTYFFFAIVKFT